MNEKQEKLFDSLAEIDGGLIEEAYKIDNAKKLRRYSEDEKGVSVTKIRRYNMLGRVAVAVACLCLCVITVFNVLPRLNNITPPTPGGDETPGERVSSSEMIEEVNEYLRKRNSEYNTGILSFCDKIARVKHGTRMLHVKFDADNYYFVCAYYVANKGQKIDKSFKDPENYIWVKFDNESEIPEYYVDAECVAIVQINKTEICRDIISNENRVPNIEHIRALKPEFENGYNITPHMLIDDTFIYLNDSDKNNIYYNTSKSVVHKNQTVPCIKLEGEYYMAHPIGDALNAEELSDQFGDYYDYLIDIMITDKYDAETCPYGLFRFENIANIFK